MMAASLEHNDADLWDDDAIVNDWKETLAEYKKYHSMAARGEKVADVVQKIQKGQYGGAYAEYLESAVQSQPNGSRISEMTKAQSASEQLDDGAVADEGEILVEQELSTANKDENTAQQVSNAAAQLPLPPAPSEDEAINALARSWYWAGFYAGQLHERRRIAKIQEPATHNG